MRALAWYSFGWESGWLTNQLQEFMEASLVLSWTGGLRLLCELSYLLGNLGSAFGVFIAYHRQQSVDIQ
jgi:hypothetical protein